MRHLGWFRKAPAILILSPLWLCCAAGAALAAVGSLTITRLPPDAPVTLTRPDDPKVTLETRASAAGTARFDLSGLALPAGSSVTVSAGGQTKTIPSLADGDTTRDFQNPQLGAHGAPARGWTASVLTAFERRQTGRAGSGTFVGPDKFVVESAEWISGVAPALHLTGPLCAKDLDIDVRGFFGSDRNGGGEPAGGRSTGIVFDRLFAGSTGIGLASTGIGASSKVDVKAFEVAFAVTDLFYRRERERSLIKFGPRIVVGHDQTDYSTRLRDLTFPGITSSKQRDVTQTYGGPGLGLQKSHRLTDQLEVYAGVNLDAIYSSGDYDGRQRTLCDLCPLALQDARIKTSDQKSQWSVRPSVSAGLEYEFNRSSIGANLGYEYWSNFLVLRDRPSPSKPAPHFETDGAHRVRVGVFYSYRF